MWLIRENMACRSVEMSLLCRFTLVLTVSCFLPVLNNLAGAEVQTAVIDKITGQLSLVEGYREDFVAWANFTDDIQTSG